MDPAHARHVVRTRRRDRDLQRHPGPGVEQRQDLGRGKAASRLLFAGLTEPTLEFGNVGHGEGRAVDQEGAMHAAKPLGFGDGNQRRHQIAKHDLEDG